MEPSKYERRALERIHEWKNPELGWFGQTMQQIGWPGAMQDLGRLIGDAGDAVGATALFDVFNKAVAGIVSALSDAASSTIKPEAVHAAYRKAGHDVQQRTDVFCLDLERVDETVGRLDAKYKGLAFTQGAAAGVVGIPGLIADIPALVTLNLLAISEYATFHGFDVSSQSERLFVLQVLGLASSPDAAAKQAIMAELATIARAAARKKAWKKLEEHVLVAIVQRIAKALGVRLTKAKLAGAVPIMGAAVGGGFNAYYTARVCDAAYHLYRERFLAEKYGSEIVDVTANLAEEQGIEHCYPEAGQEMPGEE